MSWESRVIDTLCDLKRRGHGFDAAWGMALRAHPPSARALGYRETLFAVDGEQDELSTVEWVRWAAEEAWHGRRPVLTHLANALGMTDVRDAA